MVHAFWITKLLAWSYVHNLPFFIEMKVLVQFQN